jgi:hypothetical protein
MYPTKTCAYNLYHISVYTQFTTYRGNLPIRNLLCVLQIAKTQDIQAILPSFPGAVQREEDWEGQTTSNEANHLCLAQIAEKEETIETVSTEDSLITAVTVHQPSPG